LVTKGVDEPYRLFTSRAEYRLLLREDNAHLRLSKYGYEIGLISEEFYQRVQELQKNIDEVVQELQNTYMTPTKENILFLQSIGQEKIKDKTSYLKIVGRKGVPKDILEVLNPKYGFLNYEAKEQILIEAKYFNYIQKQREQIEKMKEMLSIKIPENFDFSKVSGLSNEVVEKLQKYNPPNLQSASQISGITPAAIDILHIYIKMEEKRKH